jgi:hypothetical protein
VFNKDTHTSDTWDGKAKRNRLVEIGTYTWYAIFNDFKGNPHEKTGAVTVIR